MARFVEFKLENERIFINVDLVAYATPFKSTVGSMTGTSLWFVNSHGKDNDLQRRIIHESYEEVKAKLNP